MHLCPSEIIIFGILGKMNVAAFRDVNMPHGYFYTYTFHNFSSTISWWMNKNIIISLPVQPRYNFIAYTSLAKTYKHSKDMMKLCWSDMEVTWRKTVRKFSIYLYVSDQSPSNYEWNSAYDTISAAVFWCIIFYRCPEIRKFCPSVKRLKFQRSQKRGQWND